MDQIRNEPRCGRRPSRRGHSGVLRSRGMRRNSWVPPEAGMQALARTPQAATRSGIAGTLSARSLISLNSAGLSVTPPPCDKRFEQSLDDEFPHFGLSSEGGVSPAVDGIIAAEVRFAEARVQLEAGVAVRTLGEELAECEAREYDAIEAAAFCEEECDELKDQLREARQVYSEVAAARRSDSAKIRSAEGDAQMEAARWAAAKDRWAAERAALLSQRDELVEALSQAEARVEAAETAEDGRAELEKRRAIRAEQRAADAEAEAEVARREVEALRLAEAALRGAHAREIIELLRGTPRSQEPRAVDAVEAAAREAGQALSTLQEETPSNRPRARQCEQSAFDTLRSLHEAVMDESARALNSFDSVFCAGERRSRAADARRRSRHGEGPPARRAARVPPLRVDRAMRGRDWPKARTPAAPAAADASAATATPAEHDSAVRRVLRWFEIGPASPDDADAKDHIRYSDDSRSGRRAA